MDRLQYLLSKLAEECGELAQAACKAQQFGLDSVNPITVKTSRQELDLEFTDVMGVLQLLHEEFNVLAQEDVDPLIQAKIDKINKYYQISKQEGFVR